MHLISDNVILHSKNNHNSPAVIKPGGSGASYNDLISVYEAVANFLDSNGVMYYDRVAISSNDDLLYALLILPVMEKAVAVPVDFDSSETQIKETFKLMKVSYLITDEIDTMLCNVAVLAGIGIISAQFSGSMGSLKCHLDLIQKNNLPPIPSQFRNKDLAIMQTTSGTTSSAKAVPMYYSSQLNVIKKHIKYYKYDKNTYHLIAIKMSRGISISTLLVTLYIGGKMLLGSGLTYGELTKAFNSKPITAFTANPAYLLSLADYLENNSIKISNSNLKFIRTAGAPLSEPLKERLEKIFQVTVSQSYGMTETFNITTDYLASKGRKKGSVGVPFDLQVMIKDGEILVKGDSVFEGYETDAGYDTACIIDGWFYTGDLGYIDADGYIFITGRIKEMINRGGEKVSPYEVEELLLNHPNIAEAAVFSWPGIDNMEEVGAAVVLKGIQDISLQELRSYLQGSIISFKMPTLLYIVEKMPISDSGKIQRKDLFHLLDSQYKGEKLFGEVENLPGQLFYPWRDESLDLSIRLKLLWQHILKIRELGTSESFFDLGGDSLAAVHLLSALEDEFDIQVPINVFFKTPTIDNLVQFIQTSESGQINYDYIVPIKKEGTGVPLFCVHRQSGEVVSYRVLADHIEDRPVFGFRFTANNYNPDNPISFKEIAAMYNEEMLKMCPDGPYLLCGQCLGGRIAAEMANQLIAQGRNVSLIALFDPIIPSASQKLKRNIKELIKKTPAELPGYLMKKGNRVIRYIKLKLGKARKKKTSTPTNIEYSKQDILHIAGMRYVESYIDAKVYYFLPTENNESGFRSVELWKGLTKELEVITMPGSHDTINDDVNMRFIAEEINRIIEFGLAISD